MMKLDRAWWTAFAFFIAGVAISTGCTLAVYGVQRRDVAELHKLITSHGAPAARPVAPMPRRSGVDI